MSLHSVIADGGKVLVVGGLEKHFQRFRDHPQIVLWNGERKDIARFVKNNDGRIPDNCRAVILSRFLSHAESGPIMADARSRRALIMPMKNDGEIKALLSEIVTPVIRVSQQETKEVMAEESKPAQRQTAQKGQILELVKAHDNPSNTAVAEARKIFAIAQEKGIPTTLPSVEQRIRQFRRKLGIVGPRAKSQAKKAQQKAAQTPKAPALSVTPKVQTNGEALMTMINDAMAALALVRDEVQKMQKNHQEIIKLRESLDRIAI